MTEAPWGFGVDGVSARTFHGRKGRLSARKREAVSSLLPRWALPDGSLDRPSLARLFGRSAPVIVEIGSGTGDATVELARHQPEIDIVACEVHTAGVANLAILLDETGLSNIRIAPTDGLEVLVRCGDGTINGIRAFFPDPWPKPAQRRRRLVQPRVLDVWARVLAVGSTVHLATDWGEYGDQMRAVLGADRRFELLDDDDVPWRPETKYVRAGRAAGRPITDLAARRRAD